MLALIEQVRNQTAEMLRAARAGNWDVLRRMELERMPLFASWQQQLHQGAATPPAAAPIIENILAAEDTIRQLITARMVELKDDVQSAGNRRRLKDAYGA